MIHHLVAASDWRGAGPRTYAPPSLESDGFVHCAGDLATVLEVANRFYRHVPGEVLVLDVAEERLSAPVRWEAPAPPDGSSAGPDDRCFPHVYGPIDLCAVVEVRRFVRDPDGTYLGIDRTW